MFITKDRVAKLSDPNVSKREYDAILSDISDRVNYIWRELCKISKRKMQWYAFGNDVELGNGDGSTGGHFDPETDSEFIELFGEYNYNDDVDGDYANGFHTRFLWTDDAIWKAEVLNHINENKRRLKEAEQDAAKANADAKTKRDTIVNAIKSKLTKEELKYVTFKSL